MKTFLCPARKNDIVSKYAHGPHRNEITAANVWGTPEQKFIEEKVLAVFGLGRGYETYRDVECVSPEDFEDLGAWLLPVFTSLHGKDATGEFPGSGMINGWKCSCGAFVQDDDQLYWHAKCSRDSTCHP